MTEKNEMSVVMESNLAASENESDRDVESNGRITEADGVNTYHQRLPENDIPINLHNRDFRHKLWQLVTFFRRVFIYFVVVVLADNEYLSLPSWGRLIFKCLPVFTLSVFIFRQFNSVTLLRKNKYSFLIFIGMTFSYIADGLLVYQDYHTAYFLSGLIVFAIAHIFYIVAFGFRPFNTRMMARTLIAAGLVYYYLYTGNLQTSGLGLVVGVAFYALIIMSMQWRAWARLSYQDILAGRYYEILGAVGSSFFALSDSILGINKFRFSVPGSDYSIMATYYVGQMLIALSVIDGPNIRWPQDSIEESDGITFLLRPPLSFMKSSSAKLINWLIS